MQSSPTLFYAHSPGPGACWEPHSTLSTLILTPSTKNSTRSYMMDFVTAELKQQVETLTKAKAGYHSNASKASVDEIEKCDIARLSEGMEAAAPDVWNLLGSLLQSDPDVTTKGERARAKRLRKARARRPEVDETAPEAHGDGSEDQMELDEDGEMSVQNSDSELTGVDDVEMDDEQKSDEGPDDDGLNLDENEDEENRNDERREAKLLRNKQVGCLSVFMQSTNQKCNSLQAMVGLFLQAAGAPETVVELLAHLGLSISTTSINGAVTSLFQKVDEQIREAGATMTTMYGWDNLDFMLKHATPTVENTHESNLCHLTSCTAQPLHHGVTPEDLDCGDQVREIHQNPNTISMDHIRERLSEDADEKGFFSFHRYQI
ncbi:hypothetical protein NP233_g91 [Leucocoprinus birnbaumii]|uniref:Uncharacterized protein n=1 Tax=Leucocoprinus birnbaumii TaxID=56174 RepID=A0AAD5W4I9_9AGAR|nr:hypothetical protein NP233_g91 [Leucocoprinus birnbaumii]